MAANLNKVFLMGNLTRDPELRYTAQGTAVASFSIAVNRSYKGSDGDFKKEVNFFKIIVWGKTGENCSNYLSKGRPVLVEGRLNNNSYETKEGQKRTATEVIADNVQFIGPVDNNSHDKNKNPQGQNDDPHGYNDPASPNYGGDPNDEDVPF